MFKWGLLFSFLFMYSPYAIERGHLIYLMQSRSIQEAVSLYEKYQKQEGRHDFEILLPLALSILQEGIRSQDLHIQLSSLYSAATARIKLPTEILEQGIKSSNWETQLITISLLGMMNDDKGDEILIKAMNSPFLMTRIESGFYLAFKKHRKALGYLESLMYKLPSELWFYFPRFFALIGTSDAVEILKKLMGHPLPFIRVEAILNAAYFGRDDLLPKIQAHATHLHPEEQEACATAFRYLSDSKSIPILNRLANSPLSSVKLAALAALYELGKTKVLSSIIDLAKGGDLFAITVLGELQEGREVLANLMKTDNINVRFNAMLALLEMKDSRALEGVLEFLFNEDIGFRQLVSNGHGLRAWKVVTVARQRMERIPFEENADLLSLQLKEGLIAASLNLSPSDFLKVAKQIFKNQALSLIPQLVTLMEREGSDDTLALLKREADQAFCPLIRHYCNLALYRLNQPGSYEERLIFWVVQMQSHEMIQFHSPVPRNFSWSGKTFSPYELTPEEHTRLLFDIYLALADKHEEKGIEVILEAIKNGHPKNRYALAGLLIHTLQ